MNNEFTNRDLEAGCFTTIAFVVIAIVSYYIDYNYHLLIAKEAIKQTQSEKQK